MASVRPHRARQTRWYVGTWVSSSWLLARSIDLLLVGVSPENCRLSPPQRVTPREHRFRQRPVIGAGDDTYRARGEAMAARLAQRLGGLLIAVLDCHDRVVALRCPTTKRLDRQAHPFRSARERRRRDAAPLIVRGDRRHATPAFRVAERLRPHGVAACFPPGEECPRLAVPLLVYVGQHGGEPGVFEREVVAALQRVPHGRRVRVVVPR